VSAKILQNTKPGGAWSLHPEISPTKIELDFISIHLEDSTFGSSVPANFASR